MYHHVYSLEAGYNETVTIFFFGDLQYGAEGFNKEAWEEFSRQVKTTKNAYIIGLGDYEDWLRPTMRARLYGSLSHDDSARKQLDDKVRTSQDKIIDMLDFMRGRIIGLHTGHHDWEFSSGMSSTQRLSEALGTTFLGWQASTRVSMKIKTPGEYRAPTYTYTIISTHGNSNARRIGSSTLWLENNLMQGWVADQYVMGHGCKSANWAPVERSIIRRSGPPGAITVVPRCLLVGGFHNGYTNGWESSYVERSGFVPQPVMWGIVRLKITTDKFMATQGRNGRGEKNLVLHIETLNQGKDAQAFLYEGTGK